MLILLHEISQKQYYNIFRKKLVKLLRLKSFFFIFYKFIYFVNQNLNIVSVPEKFSEKNVIENFLSECKRCKRNTNIFFC